MLFKCRGVLHAIDRECILAEPRNRRPAQFAATRQQQPVVTERAGFAARGRHTHGLVADSDFVDTPLDVVHTNGVKQRQKRREHQMRLAFVHPWPDLQLGFRRDQRNVDVASRCAGAVEHASRPEGTPHSGKAGTHNQDLLRHDSCLKFLDYQVDDVHRNYNKRSPVALRDDR